MPESEPLEKNGVLDLVWIGGFRRVGGGGGGGGAEGPKPWRNPRRFS